MTATQRQLLWLLPACLAATPCAAGAQQSLAEQSKNDSYRGVELRTRSDLNFGLDLNLGGGDFPQPASSDNAPGGLFAGLGVYASYALAPMLRLFASGTLQTSIGGNMGDLGSEDAEQSDGGSQAGGEAGVGLFPLVWTKTGRVEVERDSFGVSTELVSSAEVEGSSYWMLGARGGFWYAQYAQTSPSTELSLTNPWAFGGLQLAHKRNVGVVLAGAGPRSGDTWLDLYADLLFDAGTRYEIAGAPTDLDTAVGYRLGIRYQDDIGSQTPWRPSPAVPSTGARPTEAAI